jgi:protein TonB
MNNPTNVLSFEQLLRDVLLKAEAFDYADALAILEIACSSDPGNIYIAALKRQLESLFTLDMGSQLTDEKRRELSDPMLGIAECALREFKQPHTSPPPPHTTSPAPRAAHPPSAPPEDPPPTEEMAAKELEALKLLYFQRASKFVMRGEYEEALAEVQRVFVVDPQNMIAREYASRVEHLIEHARKLASEPIEDSHTDAPDPAPEVGLTANPETPEDAHNARATSWNDEFLSPLQAAPIPEYRPASPAHRQTVAYGDSLAAVLGPLPGSESDAPAPRRSRKARVILAAAVVLFVSGGMFAIFSSRNAGAGERDDQAAAPPNNVNTNAVAAAVVLQREKPAVESQTSASGIHGTAAPQQVVQAPAVAEPKQKAEPLQAAPQPAPQSTPPARDSAPVKQEERPAVAVAEPTPAQIEPPPESPAFVAVEKDPQIVSLVKPQFPGFVWKTASEGQVVIKVLIDAGGKPIDTQVLKSSSIVFEEGVKEAVMKSQFTPAQMGQGPVSAWLTIPFRFKQPR